MISEALSIEQYPAIDWSRVVKIHEDRYEEFGYGLTRIRIGDRFWELNTSGMIIPRHVEGGFNSAVFFGEADQRPVAKVLAEADYPFIFEDASRINEVGELTRQFLASFEQMVASRMVLQDSNKLLNQLRPLDIEDPELVEQIGVLQDKAKDQIGRVLPTRSIEIAERLKALQVKEFGEAGIKAGLWTPDWVIERFPQLIY